MRKKAKNINSGTWVKGQSGNPAGRPKGSKNRFSKATREYIREAVGFHIQNLKGDLATMTPAERVKALGAIMKYVLSTKQEIKGKMQGQVQVNVNFKNKQLDNKKDNPNIINLPPNDSATYE